MKAVILSVAVLLLATISVQAQTCSSPGYSEVAVIDCTQIKPNILVPNYNDITTYYKCPDQAAKSQAQLFNCPAGQYFCNVFQQCGPCSDYIPAVPCSNLKVPVTCAANGGSTAAPATTTTVSSGSSTTPKSTTTKSTTTKTSTTAGMPTPPVDGESSTTTAATPGDTPGGTTIYVPDPPSPNEGPTPPGPDPTVPNLPSGPPVVS